LHPTDTIIVLFAVGCASNQGVQRLKSGHAPSFPAHSCYFSILLVVFIVIPRLVSADSMTSNAQPGQISSDNLFNTRGYFAAKYVNRKTHLGDERVIDQDLFSELRIDMTMPKENKYEFHFFGTARDDLSNNHNSTSFYPFEDIGDTYGANYHGYLYEAHVDLNDPFSHCTQVRIGRQAGTRDEPLFFDGAATDIAAASNLDLTLYGGAAVHFYEIGNRWGDDTLAGAGLDYTPASSTKVGLDYLVVRDAHSFPDEVDRSDRMTSLKLWQGVAPFMKASVKYRYLNSEPRDVSVRAVSAFPEADSEVNINYFRQFRVQNELSNELSLYYDVLGQSAPYQSYDAKFRKLFGPHYAMDIGYFKRALLEESQESAFDRDFSRTFLLFEFIDLPKDGLSFTLTGERWKATGREYSSAGLDIGYAFNNRKNAGINAGTYYSLYKYDYYIEEGARENVRTYYVKGRYPLYNSFSVNGSYEYEDSIEDYQTLKLGMRYDF
jgi:hypothetical protein